MHHRCLPHIQPPTGDWCASKPPLVGDNYLMADGQQNGQGSTTGLSNDITTQYPVI
jgi:hypothetical protein